MLSGTISGQRDVTGTLTDAATGEPIAQGNIVVLGTARGDAADDLGRYFIANLTEGRITLVFSGMGFETVERTLTLRSSLVTLDVALQATVLEFDPLTVVRNRVDMIGDAANLYAIPGAAHIISRAAMRKQSPTDIHRILQQVPGINIQEEDGFGLRPNIGMRGTGVERSQKIALMEDGVLIAPAPYSAPSAYYFPEVGRMERIEVRKGSSQIKYGPNTGGGALNMVSTSLPGPLSSHVNLSTGAFHARRAHVYAGASTGRVGWLVETYQHANDGFKVLDQGGHTGFRIADYLAKVRVAWRKGGARYQTLELKFGFTDEVSNETYLGLTEEDFRSTPARRYAASQKDRLEAQHWQLGLTHFVTWGKQADLTTTVYYNDFRRNWYKLDRVGRVKVADVLSDPANFTAQMALLSATDSDADQYQMKANKRSYFAQGVQSLLVLQAGQGRTVHEIELGLRYHADGEDRFQHMDGYQMVGGELVLSSPGTPGTGEDNNRVSSAGATAVFAQDRFAWKALTITAGLRYESIAFRRRDYGADDPERTGASLMTVKTAVTALIPGVGVDYRLGTALSLFGGVHKGFSPPGPGADAATRAEESINTEVGLRYRGKQLQAIGVAFFNQYDNLLGSDLNAVGGEGSGDLFNGGEADVLGVETVLRHEVRHKGIAFPMVVTYTFTEARFRNSFESQFAPWGSVRAGDELPYLPRHQLVVSAGIEGAVGGVTVSGRHISPMRTETGQGSLTTDKSTDRVLVFDLTAELAMSTGTRVYVKAANLTDRTYVVARRPAGARPGMPRSVSIGVRLDL